MPRCLALAVVLALLLVDCDAGGLLELEEVACGDGGAEAGACDGGR